MYFNKTNFPYKQNPLSKLITIGRTKIRFTLKNFTFDYEMYKNFDI